MKAATTCTAKLISGWTQGVYGWSVNTNDPLFASLESVDVLLCLGDL